MNKKILSSVGSNSKTKSAMIKELGSIEININQDETEKLGDIIDETKTKPNVLEDSFVYSIKKTEEMILDENIYSEDLLNFKAKKLDKKYSIIDKQINNQRKLDDINLYDN